MDIRIQEILEKNPDVIRVDREFDIPLRELWDWVTKPELTAKWFGPWRRTGEDQIEIDLIREEGSPTFPARLLEYNEKSGYTLLVGENTTDWQLLVATEELEGGGSRFTLIHPWEREDHRQEMQAGWEFYGDCLKAAINGTPSPKFSDYVSPETGGEKP